MLYKLNEIKMYETSKQDQANDKHLVNNNCCYQKMFIQKLEKIKYSQIFYFLFIFL